MFAPWETVLYTSFRYGMQLPLPEFLTKPVWSIILCFDVCYRNNKGGIGYQTLDPALSAPKQTKATHHRSSRPPCCLRVGLLM